MKVTLVNPPYPPAVHAHPPFIPLGIAYLCAVAEKEGHQVTVIDCQAEKLNYEAFRERIRRTPSDIIGVTSTTLLYKSAMKLINEAKQAHPQAVTMLGGSHGTFWDENALNEYPSLDIVVRKEGETTFTELLNKLQTKTSINSVQGITFRHKNGKIIQILNVWSVGVAGDFACFVAVGDALDVFDVCLGLEFVEEFCEGCFSFSAYDDV